MVSFYNLQTRLCISQTRLPWEYDAIRAGTLFFNCFLFILAQCSNWPNFMAKLLLVFELCTPPTPTYKGRKSPALIGLNMQYHYIAILFYIGSCTFFGSVLHFEQKWYTKTPKIWKLILPLVRHGAHFCPGL